MSASAGIPQYAARATSGSTCGPPNGDTRVDLFNNEIGRRIGEQVSAISQIEAKVRAAIANGDLATREDDLRL